MNESAERYSQYAIVDIGANSVRMNLYEIDTETGDYTVTSSARSMLGLAAYVENGALTADGKGKLFAVLREFLARANSVPCDRFSAFATASLRGLRDADRILADIRTRLGVEIEIISGQTEAQFDLDAIRYRFPDVPHGVVLDMGGGSTEIVPFRNGTALSLDSLPIGCVALTKKFASCTKKSPFPSEKEMDDIRAYVRDVLSAHSALRGIGGTAFLIGGTGRAAAKLQLAKTGETLTDGYRFSADALRETAEAAWADARTGGALLQKIVPDRLTSILPGLYAYLEIASYLGLSDFIISAAGVREGYLLNVIRKEILRTVPES